MINKDKTKATGSVNIVVWDESGNETQNYTVPNLVVDTGLDYIASRMKDTTKAAMSHMAVGTGNTAAAVGDITLATETGRVVLTSTTVTDNYIQYSTTFDAGVATGGLQEAGIFNDPSAGDLLCRTTFGVINKGAADTMSIAWTITIS